MRALFFLALFSPAAAAFAAEAAPEYGARGLYPVYETAGQWAIFDKSTKAGGSAALKPGGKFLVVGSAGADLFDVARASAAYGGACRKNRPLRMRTALLKGPRRNVGDPVLAIKVPDDFSLAGSHAVYKAMPNAVDEPLYQALGAPLKDATISEAKDGAFHFKLDDDGSQAFLTDPKPEKVLLKIDYAAKPRVAGLKDGTALVTEAQISNSSKRCLRLADGGKLLGECVEMPRELMAETALLRFVSYDPSGKGSPLLMAYTKDETLWGHERWVFALRAAGPKLFLRDAMDPRCREGF